MILKYLTFLFIFLCFAQTLSYSQVAQVKNSDQGHRLEKIIAKNIDAFTLILTFKKRLEKSFFLKDELDLGILRNGYANYHDQISIIKTSTDLQYIDSAYKIATYTTSPMYVQNLCSKMEYLMGISDNRYLFNNKFLVAYRASNVNPESVAVKFISGSFIKTGVWDDYKHLGMTAENILNFLKIKCYAFDYRSIGFLSDDRYYQYFKIILNQPIFSTYYVTYKTGKHKGETLPYKDTITVLTLKFDKRTPDMITLLYKNKIFWKSDFEHEINIFGY